MNDDLISRDALKENIERIKQNVEEWVNHTECDTTKAIVRISLYEEFIEAIDNAPTVEPFEPDYVGAERLKARQRGYEDGYRNGMKIGKTLNPRIKQGEWLTHRVAFHLTCPFCGCNLRALKSEVFEGDYDYNFCPHCGAKMEVQND